MNRFIYDACLEIYLSCSPRGAQDQYEVSHGVAERRV